MIAPRLFTIDRQGPGRLWTMAAPRGAECLADEVAALRSLGVDTLVSMLTDAENWELDLLEEARVAQERGLGFLSLPTRDRGLPDPSTTKRTGEDLARELARGRGVAIHCRAGIGRSSVLAAYVMGLEGIPVAEAWPRISRARGLPVPDTDEQARFVERLLRSVGSHRHADQASTTQPNDPASTTN